MDIFRMVKPGIHLFLLPLGSGIGLKHFFKGSLPCLFSLFLRNTYMSVRECSVSRHLANHGIGNGKLSHPALRHFCDDIAESRGKQVSLINIMLNLHTHPVSERHPAHRRNDAVAVKGIRRHNPSRTNVFREFSVLLHHLAIHGNVIFIRRNPQPHKPVPRRFKLRRDNVAFFRHVHGKGDKGRRHVNVLKCSGHAVFPSDGRQPEPELRAVCAQERRERLAPSLRLHAHAAEILLERKADLSKIAAVCHNLCHRLRHRIDCPVIRTPCRQIGVKPIAHHRNRIAVALKHRQLCPMA